MHAAVLTTAACASPVAEDPRIERAWRVASAIDRAVGSRAGPDFAGVYLGELLSVRWRVELERDNSFRFSTSDDDLRERVVRGVWWLDRVSLFGAELCLHPIVAAGEPPPERELWLLAWPADRPTELRFESATDRAAWSVLRTDRNVRFVRSPADDRPRVR